MGLGGRANGWHDGSHGVDGMDRYNDVGRVVVWSSVSPLIVCVVVWPIDSICIIDDVLCLMLVVIDMIPSLSLSHLIQSLIQSLSLS